MPCPGFFLIHLCPSFLPPSPATLAWGPSPPFISCLLWHSCPFFCPSLEGPSPRSWHAKVLLFIQILAPCQVLPDLPIHVSLHISLSTVLHSTSFILHSLKLFYHRISGLHSIFLKQNGNFPKSRSLVSCATLYSYHLGQYLEYSR